jgi:hypothetical protein
VKGLAVCLALMSNKSLGETEYDVENVCRKDVFFCSCEADEREANAE